MWKRLTKAQYLEAVHTPRRRFERLRLRGSMVSLQRRIAAPSYWFQRDDVGEMEGKYWRVSTRGTVSLFVDGKVSALFYLVGRRLDTCTFAYHLTPAELDKAVLVLERTGLARLIVPAAQWALREMPEQRRAVLEGALRRLLKNRRAEVSKPGRRRTRG